MGSERLRLKSLESSTSERPPWNKPLALEAQIGLLRDHVVVAVVMQDGKVVAVSESSDEEVDRRESMVANPRELALSLERAPLNVLIDAERGECEQLVHEPFVITGVPRRVTGLEEEWQARGDVASLEGSSELSRAFIWNRGVPKPYPGGVVE